VPRESHMRLVSARCVRRCAPASRGRLLASSITFRHSTHHNRAWNTLLNFPDESSRRTLQAKSDFLGRKCHEEILHVIKADRSIRVFCQPSNERSANHINLYQSWAAYVGMKLKKNCEEGPELKDGDLTLFRSILNTGTLCGSSRLGGYVGLAMQHVNKGKQQQLFRL
jgi:hypothetical protein